MKHLHHIVPKHVGGTDEPSNLVELTVEEHAEAHKILFETHGRWQDYIAWKGLSGIITESEIHSEVTKAGMKEWWNNLTEEEKQDWKDRCSKRPEGWTQPTGWTYTHTEEAKEKISSFQKSFIKTKEHKQKISQNRKGKALADRNSMSNPIHREKLSQTCLGRKRVYREDGTWFWGRG